MSSSIYLLDANIFIQAKNFHYRFDFCQVFWDWIIQAHHAGLVYSIDKVKNELNQYKGKANDPICQWMGDSALKNFFLPDLKVMLEFVLRMLKLCNGFLETVITHNKQKMNLCNQMWQMLS